MATYTEVEKFHMVVYPQNEVERRVVQKAAEIAYSYINAALDKCYTVPFSTTPNIIESISDLMTRMIAEFLVGLGRMPMVQDIEKKSGTMNPIVMLKMLCTGELTIPGVSKKSGSGSWLSTADQMHIFDLDHEFEHVADPDRLDDLTDDRVDYP